MLTMIHGVKRNLNWRRGRYNPDIEQWSPPRDVQLVTATLPLTSFMPAWDQGQEGSCTGNGNGRLVTHRKHAQDGSIFMPSRQFLYYNERLIEGDVKQDAGAQVGDGMVALAKYGICPESSWPYSKKFSTKPSKAAYALALKELGLVSQTVPASVSALKQAIGSGNPLSGGFDVYSSFESQSVANTGIMPVPAKKEQLLGGHCVCWDGFDDKFNALGHTGFFYCANSWGLKWGLKNYAGWFMMPYDNIKFCSDFHILLKVS